MSTEMYYMGGRSSSGSSSGSSSSSGASYVNPNTQLCVGVWCDRVGGSDTQYIGYFYYFWPDAVDHYEAQWYYLNGGNSWIAAGVQNVSTSMYTQFWEDGKYHTRYQTTYSIPSGVTVKAVKFRVRPISAKRQVYVGMSSSGSARYEQQPYFSNSGWAWSEAHTNAASLAAPDAPTNLKAELSGTNAKLTWTCSSALASSVVVYRSMDGGTWGTLATLKRAANGTYVDRTCVVGHRYSYRLRALNGSSNKYSAYTSAVSVIEKPSAPTGLKATLANATGVKLTWTNTGKVGDGFVVYYSDDFNALKNNSLTNVHSKSFDGTGTVCQIDGLERGKTWYFRLKRRSEAGLSGYATTVTSTAQSKVVTASLALAADPSTVVTTPARPTAEALYVDGSGMLRIVALVVGQKSGEKWEVQWSHVSGYTDDTTRTVTVEDAPKAIRKNQTTGAYSYGSATSKLVAVGTGLIYAMSEPDAGTTYYVRVRRVNDKKQSAWTSLGSVAVPADTAPAAAAPTLAAAYANGAYLNIVWGNAGSRADEKSEVQISTVSASFTDDTVQTLTYEGAYRTVYERDGAWSYERASGWAAWQMGVIYTLTSVEADVTYWVRARRLNSNDTPSAWSETLACTIPAAPGEGKPVAPPTAPTALTCRAQSDEHPDNVRLDWAEAEGATPDAEFATYEVQWTSNAGAFADNAAGDIESADYETEEADATAQHFTVTGLERGVQWWFRVRKVNELGNSGWASALAGDTWASETVCTMAVEPEVETLAAPTTVATLAGYQMGDVINLAWTHNSEQESEQSAWEVGVRVTIDEDTTEGGMSGEGADNVLPIDLGALVFVREGVEEEVEVPDGTVIDWRVRTRGVGDWSPWSGWRTFAVWAPPSVTVGLLDGRGDDVADAGLTAMPLTVVLESGGSAEGNAVVEWWAEISAAESYDVSDYDGSGSHVGSGTVLWRGSSASGDDGFSPTRWERAVSVEELSLASGIRYEVRAGIATAQGIRVDAEPYGVTPSWDTDVPTPLVDVYFNLTQYACHVLPRCMEPVHEADAHTVTASVSSLPATIALSPSATIDSDVYVEVGGTPLTGEQWELDVDASAVTILADAGVEVPASATVMWGEPTLREGTTLAVYRLDANGEPLMLASGLANDGEQEVVDPHATFGSSAYRVVATDAETGRQGATDAVCATPVDHVVIQWGEGTCIDDEEAWDTATFAGRRIELLCDLKLDESYAPDAVMREYAGRKHPVAYYGTQRGQSGSVSSDVAIDVDAETVAMLRLMADSMTPVHVRTPSGLSFWAHVSQSTITTGYNSASGAVSLSFVRVEVPEGEVA